MNQRQKGIVESYKRAYATELREVYSRWSSKKETAFKQCRELMREKDGKNFKIISSNGYMFTAGFEFKNEKGEDCIMYITKKGAEEIKL